MTIRIVLLLLLLAGTLRAHDPGLSSAHIRTDAGHIAVQLLLAPADLEALGDSSPEAIARSGIELRTVSGDVLRAVSATKSVKPPDAEIQLRYPLPSGESVSYSAPLIADLPLGHRQVLTYRDAAGLPQLTQLLAGGHAPVQILLPGASATQPPVEVQTSLAGFFVLGVEHILTGYDHLLFLFALLLVCPSLMAAAKIITCFTLAHSLTLALATFDVVQMPGSVVEPLIAASIIYVAVENVVVKPRRRWRYVLTVAFGLIHGLGFAGILRELGVGSSGAAIAGPLLTFNLGVELGQLALAALVLPLLLRLRRSPLFLARAVPAFSLVIAAAGAYWLLQRTLFSIEG